MLHEIRRPPYDTRALYRTVDGIVDSLRRETREDPDYVTKLRGVALGLINLMGEPVAAIEPHPLIEDHVLPPIRRFLETVPENRLAPAAQRFILSKILEKVLLPINLKAQEAYGGIPLGDRWLSSPLEPPAD